MTSSPFGPRFPGDLEALRAHFMPGLSPTKTTPRADYRYRARIPHDAFSEGTARMAAAINHDNFKSAVARCQGHGRADIYADVWTVLNAAQR